MRRIVHWLVAILCGSACLSLITLIVLLLQYPNGFGLTLLIFTTFGGMAAFFGWLTVRAWRDRNVNPAILTTHGIMQTLAQELYRTISPNDAKTVHRFHELLSQNNLGEARGWLDTMHEKNPGEPWLDYERACWLQASGHHAEAADRLASVASHSVFSSASKAALLGSELTERVLAGQVREVNQRCEELLASDRSVEEKVLVLDQLASLPVYRGLASYLNEADRWSREALSLAPDSLTLRGTRGGILAERGQFHEALPLLQDVVRKSDAPIDHFTSYFYLGLIAKHDGDLKAMKKYAMRAWNYCTMPAFRERIARELVDFSPRKNPG